MSTPLIKDEFSHISDKGLRYRLRHPDRVKALNDRRSKAKHQWAKANWNRVLKQKQKSHLRHKAKRDAYAKQWQRKNGWRYAVKNKARARRSRANLEPAYVLRCAFGNKWRRVREIIPGSFITTSRSLIQLKRKLNLTAYERTKRHQPTT